MTFSVRGNVHMDSIVSSNMFGNETDKNGNNVLIKCPSECRVGWKMDQGPIKSNAENTFIIVRN